MASAPFLPPSRSRLLRPLPRAQPLPPAGQRGPGGQAAAVGLTQAQGGSGNRPPNPTAARLRCEALGQGSLSGGRGGSELPPPQAALSPSPSREGSPRPPGSRTRRPPAATHRPGRRLRSGSGSRPRSLALPSSFPASPGAGSFLGGAGFPGAGPSRRAAPPLAAPATARPGLSSRSTSPSRASRDPCPATESAGQCRGQEDAPARAAGRSPSQASNWPQASRGKTKKRQNARDEGSPVTAGRRGSSQIES